MAEYCNHPKTVRFGAESMKKAWWPVDVPPVNFGVALAPLLPAQMVIVESVSVRLCADWRVIVTVF